jgi:hypothetical protein
LKALFFFTVISLMGACGTGCTTTTYGARERKVEIDTVPSGARVYVISTEKWLDYDNKHDLLDNNGQMDAFKKGQSPVTVYLEPYHYIIVAKWDSPPRTYWQGYKPAEDGTLTLDPSHPGEESGQ